MNYKNRLPLICSSLGTHKFEELANVERLNIFGPTNGANTEFHFRIIYKIPQNPIHIDNGQQIREMNRSL